jgi:hypothetical protein
MDPHINPIGNSFASHVAAGVPTRPQQEDIHLHPIGNPVAGHGVATVPMQPQQEDIHLHPIGNSVASHGAATQPAGHHQKDIHHPPISNQVADHGDTGQLAQPARPIGNNEGRVLNSWDVFSIMVNRMIGIGIFVHPPLVLWFCGNKYLALWVWFVGGLITALRFVGTMSLSRQY